MKGENELTPEVSKLEGIQRDILSYMDARGAAREIDAMLWFAEKVEDAIQTKGAAPRESSHAAGVSSATLRQRFADGLQGGFESETT